MPSSSQKNELKTMLLIQLFPVECPCGRKANASVMLVTAGAYAMLPPNNWMVKYLDQVTMFCCDTCAREFGITCESPHHH